MSSSGICSYPAAISAGSSSSIPSGLLSRFSRSIEFRLSTSSRDGLSLALVAGSDKASGRRRGGPCPSAGDRRRATHRDGESHEAHRRKTYRRNFILESKDRAEA